MENKKMITITEVAELAQVGKITIWRWCRDGVMPQPLRITKRCLRWPEETILAWLNGEWKPAGAEKAA